jgi:glycerophosphoryl diester phosphodiesterase
MRTRGLGFLIVLLVAVGVPARPAAAAAPITVYAHRGGAAYAPENTMGAFRQAQTLWGAQGVWLEMDTQLTADGELVIMHDDSLDRTTNCSGTVISHSLASLSGCDARKVFPTWPTVEPIPTLRQVLTEGRSANWKLAVEIKNIPLEANFDALGNKVASKLVALVREVGFPTDRLVIQSFFPTSLDRVKRLGALAGFNMKTLLLTSSTLPGAPQGVGIPSILNMVFCTLRGYTIAAPDITTKDLNPLVVTLGHVLGRQVVVWTPDTPTDIAKAIGLGVDGVISNRPDLVYAAL